VIIAGAGGAAHLPGMIAAKTTLPVLGVPVATVAINGAKNAGILAAQILGAGDPTLLDRVAQYKRDLEAMVMGKVEQMAAQQG